MQTHEIESTTPSALESADERALRKQAAVRDLIRKSGRDSSRAFARLPNDELTREAWALGEAWRQSEEP
ncbi:MAG TPA: hypothetical protein DDZ88_23995 [Verrucomicrobiales bacterium]|nr:hypothetical protein [Verrucomicrobiales bacterium]